MKSTAALFIALVTLLPQSANATTLTITSGGAVLNQEVGPGGVGSLIQFRGDDFFVTQGREPIFFGDFSPAFGVEPFVQSIRFFSSAFGLGIVQVGTQQCIGSVLESCGYITLTSPGFAMPADWPINTPFVATVPFTAAGQLLVAGNQYDLAGHGMVTGTRCLTPCGPFMETRASLAYTFSVGEPPSLVLMLASIVAIGIAFFAHSQST